MVYYYGTKIGMYARTQMVYYYGTTIGMHARTQMVYYHGPKLACMLGFEKCTSIIMFLKWIYCFKKMVKT